MKARQHRSVDILLRSSATTQYYFLALCFLPVLAMATAYELHTVRGVEAFGGSTEAREILARNGFVVADPAFKQIFEPYIETPHVKNPAKIFDSGEPLPSFITTDSAWHTYHILLEEGIKEFEQIQSQRLLQFSRALWNAARRQNSNQDLALLASVGLALQDEHHRQSLAGEEKRIVEGLRTGTAEVVVPIGFSLSAVMFRAQSFYTQSPELSDYFAARQWYASVVFRLTNSRETKAAVALAMLVNSDAELLRLWTQLSEPFDVFLAPPEDGTIRQYRDAAKAVLGADVPSGALSDTQIAEIQKLLQKQLPLPRVNDQLLNPEEYAQFAKETQGFRLLPPRRLPCAVCFHNTVDPKIPHRKYPSGLDFLAASPVLRSPAAVRAAETQFGKPVTQLILKADCGPMPDSLHGQAMQLLSTLQKPLPSSAPESMRNEAWSDLQLWTQLGAWAEQRHTWALHTKLSVYYSGIITPPKGMVAPYPEFFSGLASLTRRTATALETAGLQEKFEVKSAAGKLLELFNLSEERWRDREAFKNSGKLEQLHRFLALYELNHRAELEKDETGSGSKKLQSNLRELAQRCSASGKATDSETETLRLFFDCRQNITRLLNDFAPVCDRLAELAKKTLTAQPLTDEDGRWIENYGVTLATFHFYYGNSYEVPLDNFPIVTRVFSNPLTDSMLYAGLARPQALYLIASNGETNQLYRGAVMAYREFVRPNEQLLDDESWRELISKGQAPPAPPFTHSFYAETSVADLIKRLRSEGASQFWDFGEIGETLWQLGSRATDADVPALIDLLIYSTNCVDSLSPDVAAIIGRLNWVPYQNKLLTLLASPDTILADSAAEILLQKPEALDCKRLIADFDTQPPRVRRLYCVLLSRVGQTDGARELLLRAATNGDDGVRWQAVLALGKTNYDNQRSISRLVASLKDTNQFVAAAAAHSLAALAATNAAPAILIELKSHLASTNSSVEELRRQARAIRHDLERTSRPVGGYSGGIQSPLDPDDLSGRVELNMLDRGKPRQATRLPPQVFDFHGRNYTLADALIEALADLRYSPATNALLNLLGTDYDAAATRALSKIAPEKLEGRLLSKAKDAQVDSYLRERALFMLCNMSLTNHVRELVPLLDDVTPIFYERPLPGEQWRICDRAAVSIAWMLGWEQPFGLRYVWPQQREELMKRAREWARSDQ